MDVKPRCQSCGMPLGAPGYYGTNTDGSDNHEYCTFCYQDGGFTYPEMTLKEMIAISIEHMETSLHMDEHKAKSLAHEFIPQLKRWKK